MKLSSVSMKLSSLSMKFQKDISCRRQGAWSYKLVLKTGDQKIACSSPPCRQHSFVEIDHKIFSSVILSLLLIQDGQPSDS